LSGPHLIDQHFGKQSAFILNSRGIRSLSGLVGIALALILILFPSTACADHVTLAWDPNDEPDLAGYIIYYGSQSGYYDYDVDVGNSNSVTISGLAEDVMYYFVVTAYDVAGNESDFSVELTYPVSSPNPTAVDGGGGGGGCFISAASKKSATADRKDNLKKSAMITLVISLLISTLLPRCVPIPRTRQQ
jgi:hypothetical protein